MAGASSDKINALIAREYTFVQELVWLPPRRNPFPQCTDRIVSDLRKLEVLYRWPANVSLRTGGRNNSKSSRQAAEHALSILNANAEELIRFRRSLCQKLLPMQASPSLNEFEHQAEVLIIQHLDNAWGSSKHGSVERWASRVKGLDFQAFNLALQHLFTLFFGYAIDHKEELDNCGCNSISLEKKQRHASEEAENVSDAISLCGSEEVDDEVSEVDSIEGNPAGPNQELPLLLMSNSGFKHECKSKVPNTSSRGNLPTQIEMTMKAREIVIEDRSLHLQTRRVVGMDPPQPLYIGDSTHTAAAQCGVAGPSQTAIYDGRSGDPFYKRIGNLFSRKDSCKKARTLTE
ncbi:hypothetical protein L7F22_008594 [Adiantum nelumboides]|nr:hypothetical protein [Adiantum nelumboides]